MSEWKTEILNNLCLHIQSGGTPKSDNPDYYGGEIPFVAIEDITASNKYLENTKNSITKVGLKNSSAWLVPINSIMYSIYATLGSTLISKIQATTNQAILNLIVNNKKINTEYLYYFLSSLKNQIYKYSAQTTQSNLNAAIVKKFIVSFPEDINEQSKIADILSTCDKAIEQTESIIEKYKRIKTGLMQDLLTKGIDENGNIRSEETHEFVIKNGIKVPKEWEVLKVEDFSDLKSGGTPSRNKKEYWQGEINWVKTSEINYSPIYDTDEMITTKGLNNSSATIFPENTMLIAIYGEGITRGRVALLKIKAATNQACIAFLQKSKNIRPEYLLFYFFNEYENLRRLSYDGSQKNLSKELLNNFFVKIPPTAEQNKIIEIFEKLESNLNNENKYLSKLQSLKTGLMQDLLSGKVRVLDNYIIKGDSNGKFENS